MATFIKNERLRPVLFFLSGLLLAIIFFIWSNLIEHDTGMGLKVGTVFPEFSLPDLSGTIVSSKEYKGKNMLFMFADPNCGFCKKLLPIVRDFSSKESDKISLVIVSSGADSANRTLVKEYKLSCPILIADRKLNEQRYKVTGVPFLYLVDKGGVIRGKQGGLSPNPEKVLKRLGKKVS